MSCSSSTVASELLEVFLDVQRVRQQRLLFVYYHYPILPPARLQTRNLPFYAGTAAAYGLDKEEALKLITLNTAKILGIDDMVGSLEVGKAATLFISEGDALDMRTNDINTAFIQGRLIDIDNHQKKLYRKYSEKYEK